MGSVGGVSRSTFTLASIHFSLVFGGIDKRESTLVEVLHLR